MLTYHEKRKRLGVCGLDGLYNVRSWYLFGFVLVYRRYEQLTAVGTLATPSEQR